MDSSSITLNAEGDLKDDSDANLNYVIPPGPLTNMRVLSNAIGLSPMSEIAFLVSDNMVLNSNSGSTPVTAKARSRFNGECLNY